MYPGNPFLCLERNHLLVRDFFMGEGLPRDALIGCFTGAKLYKVSWIFLGIFLLRLGF